MNTPILVATENGGDISGTALVVILVLVSVLIGLMIKMVQKTDDSGSTKNKD